MDKPKMIYLSFAQGNKINGPLLAQNISAVGIRVGQGIWEDPLFRYNYQLCLDNKIPFFFWWFLQPDMYAQFQIDAFMKIWNSLLVKPKVIALDVEEIDYRDAAGVYQKLFPPSRQFSHDNILKFCKEIARLTGCALGIYTRKIYFETWTFDVPDWYDFWIWIAAWYNYTGTVPPKLPWRWKNYKYHQYEGGGLGTPGVDPMNTCKEYFNGTLEQELAFLNGKEDTLMTTTMPLHNVLQKDRAWVFRLDDTQTMATGVKYSDTWSDMIILPAMRMDKWDTDGKHMLMKRVDTFNARATLAKSQKLYVVGEVILDAGLFPMEGHTSPEIQGWDAKSDLMLRAFLQAWVIEQGWTYEQLYAKQLHFCPMDIVDVRMVETHTYPKGSTGDIGNFWQALTFETFTNHLRFLMTSGIVPTVPIALETKGEWLERYQGEVLTMLNNRKSWLYLHLIQEVNPSTALFATLANIFEFVVPDTFEFKTAKGYKWPDGYEDRIIMHTFGVKQSTKQILDATKMFTPVEVTRFYGNSVNLADFVKNQVVLPPPPVEPPPTDEIAALKARIAELEAIIVADGEDLSEQAVRIEVLEGLLVSSKAREEEWLAWAYTMPKSEVKNNGS